MRQIRGTTPGVRANAQVLRRNPTPAEAMLWEAIRARQLAGLRFRRQHPVGRFILDFYCPSCKLVVEVDGGVHDFQADQDAFRDEHVAQYGYHVVRIRNKEILTDLPAVLDRILTEAIKAGHDVEAHGLRRRRPKST